MQGDTAISILRRLIDDAPGDLTPAAAKAILEVSFPESDQLRMAELATKSNEGELNPEEADEYDNYIAAADFLALIQSKARLSLKHQTSAA